MYEMIEFTDDRGNRIIMRAKAENGIKISNIDPEKAWTLSLQDSSGQLNTVEIIGGRERRG